MSKIKHVSFDFWGTIANPNPEFYKARENYLSEITHQTPEFIRDKFRFYKLEYEALGKKHLVGVPAQTQTLALLESLGFKYDRNSFNQIYGHLVELYYKFPPILILDLNVISNLMGRGLTFSITCNTGFLDGEMVENWLEKNTLLNDVFKLFIFSDKNDNLFKPNPLICQKIMKYFDCKSPTQILHVGDDDSTDGELCRRTGMQYFKVVGNNYSDILNYVQG